MALSETFTDCDGCGSTERKENVEHGLCEACLDLRPFRNPEKCVDEVPISVLEKLVSMAKSRHPTTCNEDARNFERVLREEGVLPERNA